MGNCHFNKGQHGSSQNIVVEGFILKKQEKISRGAYSSIWKCQDVTTGFQYALKEIRIEQRSAVKCFEKEVLLLKLTKKENICGVIHMLAAIDMRAQRQGKVGRILLELGSATLIDQINKKEFTEWETTIIIKQVAEALAELHGLGVFHLDVKPDNIIFVGGRYKLCDFGSIRTQRIVYDGLDNIEKLDFSDFIQQHTTMHYRPPEMVDLRGQEIGPEADMWMLGCCLYMVAFGRHPFEDKDPARILSCDVVYPTEGYFTQLCKGLLMKNPRQRLTARRVAEMLGEKLSFGKCGK